jgi:YqaJ-like viral recombinase domain
MSSNYFTQEEELWLKCRRGRFTASEIHKIFIKGKREMTEAELDARPKGPKGGLLDRRTTTETLFGDGAMTYIRTKLTEITTVSEDPDYLGFGEAKQLKWGRDHEYLAADEFIRVTGKQLMYHGNVCPKFIEYGEFAGGSPDGEVLNEDAILEIKCPFNTDVHTRRLFLKTIQEFKESHFEEYCQCQMNMEVTGKNYCYFASYDPRRINPKLRMKIVKLQRDQEWVDEFKMRLEQALLILSDLLVDWEVNEMVVQ